MCGIAGVRRYGEKPITEEMVSLFLTGNEHRGNDATGMVIQQKDGSLDVCKSDIPAWKFIGSDNYKEFIKAKLLEDSVGVLLHTRAATGDATPRDNNNNHPLFAGQAAVIHNGVIRNDDHLFSSLKLERKAKTDTDILRAIIDDEGITAKAITSLNKVSGSAAGAAFHPKYPGKMLIFRSGSPMSLASNENFFVFSSEKNTIHKSMRPWIKRYGVWFHSTKPDVDFSIMNDDSAWIMGPKGFESHHSFKTLTTQYVEPVRKVYSGYDSRQANWDAGEKKASNMGSCVSIAKAKLIEPCSSKKFAWCTKCQREWLIPVGDNAADYACDKENKSKPGCGGPLVEVKRKEAVN